MILGEFIGHVCNTFFPDEVKLIFLNYIFYPVKAHVKRFGEFLKHGGCNNSIGG